MKGAPEDFHFRCLKPLHQINSYLRRLMHTGQQAQHPLIHIGPSVTEWGLLPSPGLIAVISQKQQQQQLNPPSLHSLLTIPPSPAHASLPIFLICAVLSTIDVSISMILTVLVPMAALLHSSHTLTFCPLPNWNSVLSHGPLGFHQYLETLFSM